MRTPLLIGLVVALTAPRALAQQPFYVESVRQICELPRPGNNGRVVGHDNGSSVKLNGVSYFFFADTLLDTNGNGGLDSPDGADTDFVSTGTVASTTDPRAKNCIDLVDYKTSGGSATGLFADGEKLAGECFLWPLGSVVAAGNVYVFGRAVKGEGCLSYAGFLSKFDTSTRTADRMLDWPETVPSFVFPTLVTHSDGTNWVYVFGIKAVAGTQSYYMARVRDTSVETQSAYEYRTASGWATNSPGSATPLFSVWGGGQVSVVYNRYLKRFLMTYACGFGTAICGRTANVAGKDELAIDGGWSTEVQIYQCPPADGLSCYAPYQHGQFAKKAIYVTTARNSPQAKKCTSDADCRCDGSPNYTCHIPAGKSEGKCDIPFNLTDRYGLTLHEIVLAKKPPAAPIAHYSSAKEYSPPKFCLAPQQGIGRWYSKQLKNGIFSNLQFSYYWNWYGTETLGSLPVPSVDQDTMLPANDADAVRVWQPLSSPPFRIRISGEARKKFSCGDGVRVEVIRIAASGKVSLLWYADLKPSVRTARYNIPTTLNTGDSIGFRTKRAGTSADCDHVVFAPLIQKY